MQLPRRLAGPIAQTQASGAAQFEAVRQAGYSDSELEKFVAHVAADLSTETEVAQAEMDVPPMAPVEYMAAAA
jgi:hypothetical protein